MSKSLVLKTSVILTGFFLLFVTPYPVVAQDATAAGTAKKPLIQQKVNVRREQIKDKVSALQERLSSREAALKTRLQAFKDTRKAQIAERINTNLNTVNQNQTTRMKKHLEIMSDILDKLEARVNKPTPDIKDPISAAAAIASAEANIASVSAAVSAQGEKDYTIQVTTESKIRADVKTQRDKLHADLLSVRKMVIDAKRSVSEAIRTAKAGPVIDDAEPKEGTNSGQ